MDSNDLEYVGFWPRVGATIIDAVLLTVITGPLLVWIYGWAYYIDPDRPFIVGPADFLLSWVLPAVAVILFCCTSRRLRGRWRSQHAWWTRVQATRLR